MALITLTDLLGTSPVITPLDGSEPAETVVSGTSQALALRQLSTTPVNIQVANYTLVVEDQGRVVAIDSPGAVVVTIPDNTLVPLPIGATVLIRRLGVGGVNITTGVGVTFTKRVSLGNDLSEQFSQAVLHKTAINTWHLTGELVSI